MFLFKAKAAAIAELERVAKEHGVTLEQVRAFLDAHPRFDSGLHKPPHAAAGSAADLVMEIAPLIKSTRWERTVADAKKAAKVSADVLRESPQKVVTTATRASAKAVQIAGWLKEDWSAYRDSRKSARQGVGATA